MNKKHSKSEVDQSNKEQKTDHGYSGVSQFSHGLIIKPGPKVQKITQGVPAGRPMELINVMTEARYMTLSSVSIALQCNRQKSRNYLNRLLSAGLVEHSEIVTGSGFFCLWQIAGIKKPLNAQEGCRLAILSIFYALIKNEVKNFQWRLIRNNDTGLIMAEMSFWNSEGSAKWIIDAPRKGELRIDSADLYIFPEINEAKIKTPSGKLYIADNVLLNIKSAEIKERIILKNA